MICSGRHLLSIDAHSLDGDRGAGDEATEAKVQAFPDLLGLEWFHLILMIMKVSHIVHDASTGKDDGMFPDLGERRVGPCVLVDDRDECAKVAILLLTSMHGGYSAPFRRPDEAHGGSEVVFMADAWAGGSLVQHDVSRVCDGVLEKNHEAKSRGPLSFLGDAVGVREEGPPFPLRVLTDVLGNGALFLRDRSPRSSVEGERTMRR